MFLMGGSMSGAASSILVSLEIKDMDQNYLRQELAVFLQGNNITIGQIHTKFAFTCKDLVKSCVIGSGEYFDCCEGSEVIAHRDFGSCFTVKGKIQR